MHPVTPDTAATARSSDPLQGSTGHQPVPLERQTLTVEEACAILNIGRTLGYELARTGKLPTLRLGRRLVVPRPALERMLDGASTDR